MASTKIIKETTTKQDNKSATTKEDVAVIENSVSNDDSTGNDNPLCRAVGIIKGEVKFKDDDENSLIITINNKEYQILENKPNNSVFSSLQKEVAKSGQITQRLIVFPQVQYLFSRSRPPSISFQLLDLAQKQHENDIVKNLTDNEFKLSGRWQFISPCRLPCISIFFYHKNYKLEFLKASDDPATQTNFIKATHVPILWKDSLVKPFRPHPKGYINPENLFFVQIKAVFRPYRNAFAFVEQLEEPIEQVPKFKTVLPKLAKPKKKKKFSSRPKKNHQKKPKS